MKQAAVEATYSAPPMTVVGMTFLGYPLDDWLKLLGVLWLLMQMGWFAYAKFIRKDKPE